MPHYPPSAKRMLQDNGSWLKCLVKPNVELIKTGIERITPEGVVTEDGELHTADVIVYATGFRHNDYLFPMTIIGRNGINLREQFGDEPTAYLGISIPNFPNLFCLYGPGYESRPWCQSDFPIRVPSELCDERDPRTSLDRPTGNGAESGCA